MVDGSFQPTRWTLVAQVQKEATPSASKALNELCSIYWNPLYVFARSSGKSLEDAEDAVQGFLAKGVDKALFAAADRERGKMRNFLLTAFKRYMKDEWVKSMATKRGEGKVVTMDFAAEEDHFASNQEADPTDGFDKRWALMMVQKAQEVVEKKYTSEGKTEFFSAIEGALSGELTKTYAQIAAECGVSESSVKVGVHRLRKRFGEALRAEIRDTVANDSEVDDELRHLLTMLSG